MIILTGDTHGDYRRIKTYCDEHHLIKSDILIILGDARLNYMGYVVDRRLKGMLQTLSVTFFFIHGNHEMRPSSLDYYEEKMWKGGIAYIEPEFPNLIFAKDGEIYHIEDHTMMAIGGAYSIDKYYRITYGYPWFVDEQPSDEIKAYVESQLEKAGWEIDIVLSHTVPAKYIPKEAFLKGIDQANVDHSTEDWLDEIENKLKYTKWYAGHFHMKKTIDKLQILFENFEVL